MFVSIKNANQEMLKLLYKTFYKKKEKKKNEMASNT